MSLAASIQITDQDIYQTTSVAGAEELGQIASTADGRVFAYAKNGASNLLAGKITQAPAAVANDTNRTLGVAAAAGQNQVTITLGGTATADQYLGGWFFVNDGTGEGQGVYGITGNTAATAGTSNSTVVTLDRNLTTALTTGSDVSLTPNLYGGSVVHTAAVAFPTTGVPVVGVTANYYYWSQVGGYSQVLSDGAITKNAGAIPSDAVIGAVEIEVAATVVQRVGYAPELTVDTEYSALVLTLV
jgi:hypothetical protein